MTRLIRRICSLAAALLCRLDAHSLPPGFRRADPEEVGARPLWIVPCCWCHLRFVACPLPTFDAMAALNERCRNRRAS